MNKSQLPRDMTDLPIYEIVIDENENQGIRMVSLVSDPAIETKGMYFSNDKKQTDMAFKSISEKQIVVGPAMVPNKKILRKDENDNLYYVYFSSDTIRQMVDKFLKDNNNRSLNVDHSNTMVNGFIQASWIVEDPVYDKSKFYGFTLPKGSWFIEVKIDDNDFWEKDIKAEGKFGFSIEGLMGQKLVQMEKQIQEDLDYILDSLTEQELYSLFFEKISFDFDGTLSQDFVQQLAKNKMDAGDEVFIITKRSRDKGVLEVAKKIGIPEKNVIFTNHKPKWTFIKDLGINTHYDNVNDEIKEITEKTTTTVVKVPSNVSYSNCGCINYEMSGEPGLVHPNCKCQVNKGKFKTTQEACEICVEAKKQWEINGAFQNVFGNWYSKDIFGENASIGFKAVEMAKTYDDYPKAATENAKIALRWAEENGWGSCGTPVGKARANQLANGEALSRETIARMAAFERHRQNSQKELGDGCGRLMWLAWGGNEGVEWAQRKLEQIDNEEFVVEPGEKENQDEFIQRCMSVEVGENGYESSQAYAICISKWENK